MLSTKNPSARLLALLAVFAIVAGACGGGTSTAPSTEPSAAASVEPSTSADPMAALVTAAQGEGGLTTIALPLNWCNYGELIDGFTAKYNIPINGLNPGGSSQEEIDAIKANQGSTGPQAPDVIDVGLSFGPAAVAEGLLAKYKVTTCDSIPASAKDADGYWYGDYYGVLSFETNTDVQPDVPADWADLLDPKYAGQVALAGNPVKSNQAISGVWAAAFANGGGGDDAAPGLEFFKQLNDAGNYVPVIGSAATVVGGETPVRITWTYNGLADKDANAGAVNIEVGVPATGRFGGMYVQAISAYAPHPNAAKLWMEYLYSDEGQNLWLKGYCNPIRYDDMVTRDAVDAALAAKLPDTSGAFLPTLDQITAATKVITEGWPTVVGVVVPDN